MDKTEFLPQEILTDDQLKELVNEPSLLSLPQEKKEEILKLLTNTVRQRVLIRIAYALIDEDVEKIAVMDKKNDSSSIKDFIKSKVPNFDAIIQEEYAIFKEEIIDTPASQMLVSDQPARKPEEPVT